jgi:hypothetical protein
MAMHGPCKVKRAKGVKWFTDYMDERDQMFKSVIVFSVKMDRGQQIVNSGKWK